MAIIIKIETTQGVLVNYHNVFWCQLIATPQNDKVSAIIKSYISKEKYLEGKQAIEQTDLSFELTKDFNGNIRNEIYNRVKELEKFKDAQDDI